MQQIIDETAGPRPYEKDEVTEGDDDRQGKKDGQSPSATAKSQPCEIGRQCKIAQRDGTHEEERLRRYRAGAVNLRSSGWQDQEEGGEPAKDDREKENRLPETVCQGKGQSHTDFSIHLAEAAAVLRRPDCTQPVQRRSEMMDQEWRGASACSQDSSDATGSKSTGGTPARNLTG